MTMIFGMQMHATFILKCNKCRLCMQQCNAMEICTMFMTFFPIFCDFDLIFLKNTDWLLLLKYVITHATSSYFFANLIGDSLRVYALFDLVTFQFWSDGNGAIWHLINHLKYWSYGFPPSLSLSCRLLLDFFRIQG